MCLAIPGKLIDKEERLGVSIGRVQFGKIIQQACLDFVPEASIGDYVMVHVGFAISRVDTGEAEIAYEYLRKSGLLEKELETPQ
jgi:hydrogenase expression/formation protein HypC